MEKLEQLIVNAERELNPTLRPVIKFDSGRLLSKINEASGRFADDVKRILNRYLVFPIGFSDSEGYVFAYFHKPNQHTNLIYGKVNEREEFPVIFDTTILDENYHLKDPEYRNPFLFKPSEIDDPDHFFRGMAGAEFDDINKRGIIQSNQSRNHPSQKGVTCFATNLSEAFNYSFAWIPHIDTGLPWRDNSTFNDSNFIIQIKKDGIEYSLNVRQEPEIKGSIPVTNIVAAWEVRLCAANAGLFSIKEGSEGEILKGGCNRIIKSSVAIRKFSEGEISCLHEGRFKTIRTLMNDILEIFKKHIENGHLV